MDPLSFGHIWPETVRRARQHADLLLPVVGLFLFLPQLVFSRQLGDRTPDLLFKDEHVLTDALAVAFLVSFSLVGQLVIAAITLRDGTAGRTLGEVLKGAVLLLLPALAASLIQGMAIGFGLLFLIIPGLWLLARLAPVVPLVATDEPDPVGALRTAWRLTDGKALRIIAMLGLLITGFLMISIGINGIGAAVGVITVLAAGQPAEGWGVARWLFETLSAGASALFATFYGMFLAVLTLALRSAPREAD